LLAAEISLVGRGANNKRYLVVKSADAGLEGNGGMKPDILKAVVDTPLEDEAGVLEVLKSAGLGGEPAELALGMVRVIKGFEEALPENFLSIIAKASGCKLEEEGKGEKGRKKKVGEESYGYPPVTKSGEPDLIAKGLDLSKVPEEIRPQLEMLWKQAQDVRKEAEENRAAVRKMLDEKEIAHFTTIAKSFEAAPVATDELAASLRALYKADPALYDKVFPVMKALDGAAARQIFTEYGRPGTSAPTSAEGKVEALAKSIVAKDASLTYEQAYSRALEQSGLWSQIEAEKKGKGAA
jgi:hypothetical protein